MDLNPNFGSVNSENISTAGKILILLISAALLVSTFQF